MTTPMLPLWPPGRSVPLGSASITNRLHWRSSPDPLALSYLNNNKTLFRTEAAQQPGERPRGRAGKEPSARQTHPPAKPSRDRSAAHTCAQSRVGRESNPDRLPIRADPHLQPRKLRDATWSCLLCLLVSKVVPQHQLTGGGLGLNRVPGTLRSRGFHRLSRMPAGAVSRCFGLLTQTVGKNLLSRVKRFQELENSVPGLSDSCGV